MIPFTLSLSSLQLMKTYRHWSRVTQTNLLPCLRYYVLQLLAHRRLMEWKRLFMCLTSAALESQITIPNQKNEYVEKMEVVRYRKNNIIFLHQRHHTSSPPSPLHELQPVQSLIAQPHMSLDYYRLHRLHDKEQTVFLLKHCYWRPKIKAQKQTQIKIRKKIRTQKYHRWIN